MKSALEDEVIRVSLSANIILQVSRDVCITKGMEAFRVEVGGVEGLLPALRDAQGGTRSVGLKGGPPASKRWGLVALILCRPLRDSGHIPFVSGHCRARLSIVTSLRDSRDSVVRLYPNFDSDASAGLCSGLRQRGAVLHPTDEDPSAALRAFGSAVLRTGRLWHG